MDTLRLVEEHADIMCVCVQEYKVLSNTFDHLCCSTILTHDFIVTTVFYHLF